MKQQSSSFPGLTGNQLKILALIAMTCDHVGKQLFPRLIILQIIGRLAFPIYGFLIAEGCRHTRNRKRYLGNMAALAAVCQAVYLLAEGSLYMCVLVTFSISIGLIFLLDRFQKEPTLSNRLLFTGAMISAFLVCHVLYLPGTDFAVDYGFVGVMLPVLVYVGKGKGTSLFLTALSLILLGYQYGSIQWYALAALLPLALYNGQRGKRGIKNFFYLYYPAHLVIIYLISLVL